MTLAVDLPFHIYGVIDRRVLSAGERDGWESCVWFGMSCPRNRAFGLAVLLACGAVYREIPPHAFAFREEAEADWPLAQAQAWDGFGGAAQAIEYRYLREFPVKLIASGLTGAYLFTVEFGEDGFSRSPGQAKCLHALALENGRLTFQPNDRVLFHDASFTKVGAVPTWLRRQSEAWAVETWSGAS